MRVVVFLALLTRVVLSQGLTLQEAERRALELSPRIKASQEDAIAAHAGADSAFARMFPRLTIDANARYVTTVPQASVGGNVLRLGDNLNYSAGPSLTYTLFDGGAARNMWRSLDRLAEAREENRRLARLQTLTSTRIAYVQAQISQTEFKLVEQSLKLARSQQKDVSSRFRAGSASRMDFLGANREVSTYEVRAASAKAELSAAAQELAAYVGDLGNPLVLKLDALDALADQIQVKALAPPSPTHPQSRAQDKISESAELASRGQSALHWPALRVSAKTSLDYPNGAVLEQIHQNTLTASLSFPIFDWGQINRAADQKKAEALSARHMREQTQIELKRDWEKARARLTGLLEQRTSSAQAVEQSEELAHLGYQSYRLGQISLIDVQAMNLKLLESRVQKTRVDGQLLIQFSLLRSLSGTEGATVPKNQLQSDTDTEASS